MENTKTVLGSTGSPKEQCLINYRSNSTSSAICPSRARESHIHFLVLFTRDSFPNKWQKTCPIQG